MGSAMLEYSVPAVVRLPGSRVDIVLVIIKGVFTLMSRTSGIGGLGDGIWFCLCWVNVLFLGFCFLPGIYESVLTM